MQFTFQSATAFNQPLEAWDVSSVTGSPNGFHVRAASHPLSRITATASHRHGLLTLSLFLSDRLLASPLSHALLFPTVWLNRSQNTFANTNSLSDCNKARIASTWSANPRWPGGYYPHSSWSNDTAAVCPSPPPFPPGLAPLPPPLPSPPPGGGGTIVIVVVAVVAVVAIVAILGTVYYLKAIRPSLKALSQPQPSVTLAQPSVNV